MFWQMVKGALVRQSNRFMLIALTVALGVSLASAMLNVMFDVGDKVNRELKAYGANITVTPKNAALLRDVYGLTNSSAREFLNESDLGKIKAIFWTNNIVAFAPTLDGNLILKDGSELPALGTWFEHTMTLPTGETFSTGEIEMKSWWQIEGAYPVEGKSEALIGSKLAIEKNIHVGDVLELNNGDRLTISGVLTSGGDEDQALLTDLAVMQKALNVPGKIASIDISAITTPENDLARKAAANPDMLSQQEREIWYCTAYVSAIAYQIEEVIGNSSARPVRQIAESEGKILDKTQLLMLLITVLSLMSAALGVSNLVSANIMERSRELGLLKAIGATNLGVILLILTEIFIAGCIGGVVGYFAGLGLAQVIGSTVFGAGIANNVVVIPIVSVLMVTVLLVGSVPAIRMLLQLEPASVLHGR